VQARGALASAAGQQLDAHLSKGKADMQARINSYIRAVIEYEDPVWQAKAREVIPLATLQERAQTASQYTHGGAPSSACASSV
jgi:hypothetical protein